MTLELYSLSQKSGERITTRWTVICHVSSIILLKLLRGISNYQNPRVLYYYEVFLKESAPLVLRATVAFHAARAEEIKGVVEAFSNFEYVALL